MALFNRALGARIFTSIGRRGEEPDVRPARIAGPVTLHIVNGRPTEFVNVIELRENLAGEKYLAERVANVLYTWDRTELVDVLDGTEEQPKPLQTVIAERMAELAKFRASQAGMATGVEVDVTEIVGDPASA